MRKVTVYLLSVTLILIISFAAYTGYSILNDPYPFKLEREGIVFKSSEAEPGIVLQDIKNNPGFIVSPAIVEGSPLSPFMVVASNNIIVVLKANSKEVHQVARSVSPGGELLNCASNDGNVTNNRFLNSGECQALLDQSVSPIFYIEQPDASLPSPQVVVHRSRIEIQPNDISQVSRVSLETMKALYPNSEGIILLINQLLAQL